MSQITFGEWVNKWRDEWGEAMNGISAGFPRLLDAELEKLYGKHWIKMRYNDDHMDRWMYVQRASYDQQYGQGFLKLGPIVIHLASLPAKEFEMEGYTDDYVLDPKPVDMVLKPPTYMPEICTDEEWICMLNLMVPGLPRMGREYW